MPESRQSLDTRLVGKERYTGNISFSGVRPIPMLNRAFYFSGEMKNGAAG
jgi:hypothetical protein